MNRIALASLSVLLAAGVSGTALGQGTPSKPTDANKMDMKSMEMGKTSKGATSHTTTGVVEAVDAAKGSVTLAHDPVKSLSWPAMTMGFKVNDPKLLEKVKKGDKVQFTFVQSGRDYIITSIK